MHKRAQLQPLGQLGWCKLNKLRWQRHLPLCSAACPCLQGMLHTTALLRSSVSQILAISCLVQMLLRSPGSRQPLQPLVA